MPIKPNDEVFGMELDCSFFKKPQQLWFCRRFNKKGKATIYSLSPHRIKPLAKKKNKKISPIKQEVIGEDGEVYHSWWQPYQPNNVSGSIAAPAQ